MPSAPRKQSKTYKVPKRPYEAARLDAELKVRFGLVLLECVGFGLPRFALARSSLGSVDDMLRKDLMTVGSCGGGVLNTDGCFITSILPVGK